MQSFNPPSTTDVYARAGLLGFVAGLRAATPLALLAIAAYRGRFARDVGRPLSLLRSPWLQTGLSAFGALELVGDKLPSTPSRLSPPQLGTRLLMGALAGAAIAHDGGASGLAGGALGATAAGGGSLAGYHARMTLRRLTGLPDLPVALVEDATALGLGSLATQHR